MKKDPYHDMKNLDTPPHRRQRKTGITYRLRITFATAEKAIMCQGTGQEGVEERVCRMAHGDGHGGQGDHGTGAVAAAITKK